MIDNREIGLVEVLERCQTLLTTIPLKNVFRVPNKQIDQDDMPCVLLLESEDVVTKRSTTNFIGYPCARNMQVIIECWDLISGDAKNIKNEVLKAVLADKGKLGTGRLIREVKLLGPINFNIPNIEGFRVILEMTYNDLGPYQD